ncbi:MAG: hypothetical protein PHE89_01075 [Alphaproteobacteria bacterium]|nr:hypothetical protein [Alphaproteobacteria bacterium]
MKKVSQAKAFIECNCQEVISKLVDLSVTDVLMFWGTEKELVLRQEKLWRPILDWLEKTLLVKFNYSNSIDIPNQEPQTKQNIEKFISSFGDNDLAVFYVATMVLRSALLAMAFVKKQISPREAFEASFIEELWQAESWGIVEEAEERRLEIKQELTALAEFLK